MNAPSFTRTLLVLLVSTPNGMYAAVQHATYKQQFITHIGTCHSYDPNHHQYQVLTQEWQIFLQKIKGQESVVIFEQESINPLCTAPGSYQESIKTYADWGAISFLATTNQVPLVAGDPLVRDAFKQLCSFFDPQLVAYTYFIQLATMYRRLSTPMLVHYPTLQAYIEPRLQLIFPQASYAHLETLHQTIANKQPLNESSTALLHYLISPSSVPNLWYYQLFYKAPEITVVRSIIERYHLLRDTATLTIIKHHLEAGRHIFIVYGAFHQPFHMRALCTYGARIVQ